MASRIAAGLRRRWPFAIVLVVVLLAVYFGSRAIHGGGDSGAATDAARQPTPIPVTDTVVRNADFPDVLYGLGTVQPYDTVTVRSRVDGQVIEVGFRQGQMVQQGQMLVKIDPRPYQAALDEAKAKKAQDEASLKDAQLNLARYGALAKQDFASRQQFDTQQATVQQLMAEVQGDQAAIDNAQTQLSYTTISSPLTGRAGFRLVDPGNIVHATDTTGIVTIVKLQPISVVFTAPEEDLPEINKALAAGTVPVTALSSDGSRVLSEGHLAFVNNAVDQASGTIQMKATFENQDNMLWPGLSVSTRLLLRTLKNVIVVPDAAVGRGPDGQFAFLVGPDNKIQMTKVSVSHVGEGFMVIGSGLSPGQKIVISGQYELQPGTLVAATEAPPTAPEAPAIPARVATAQAAPAAPAAPPAAAAPAAAAQAR